MSYICIVFFMVLDLRLTEIGCRETINFFCPYKNVRNTLMYVVVNILDRKGGRFAKKYVSCALNLNV